jgi:hypothetical protein
METIEFNGHKTYISRFDSVAEAVAAAGQPDALNVGRQQHFRDRPPVSDSWYDGCSTKEVHTIVKEQRWAKGLKRLEQHLSDLTVEVTPVKVRRTKRWTDQGDVLDIHKVYSGQLDRAWQRSTRAPHTGPQNVRILSQSNISAATSGTVIFWRGAAVVKLTDLLTQAGFNVQVEYGDFVSDLTNNDSAYGSFTVLKPYLAPLDINALVATTCFAGYSRCYNFQMRCGVPETVNGGLGYPCEHTAIMPQEENAIACSHSVSDLHSARAWIEEQIAKLQSHLNPALV